MPRGKSYDLRGFHVFFSHHSVSRCEGKPHIFECKRILLPCRSGVGAERATHLLFFCQIQIQIRCGVAACFWIVKPGCGTRFLSCLFPVFFISICASCHNSSQELDSFFARAEMTTPNAGTNPLPPFNRIFSQSSYLHKFPRHIVIINGSRYYLRHTVVVSSTFLGAKVLLRYCYQYFFFKFDWCSNMIVFVLHFFAL